MLVHCSALYVRRYELNIINGIVKVVDWFFNIVSLKAVVLYLLCYSAISAYFRWKFEVSIQSKIHELEEQTIDIQSELEELKSEQKLLEITINRLEEDLTTDDVKVKRLVKSGVPEDVATGIVIAEKRDEQTFD